MRIGSFETDCIFRQYISLAEVQSGQAELLQSVHLCNIRGNEQSWMTVSVEIEGKIIRRTSVRNIPLADEVIAQQYEKKLKTELRLPGEMRPGRYSGTLLFTCESSEKRIPFSFEILSPSWIPTDLFHAPLLAAWIHISDDVLRGYITDAMQQSDHSDPATCYRIIYESLSGKRLLYQPVPTTVYPDFEAVSDMHYVLEKGGSCADLSLLTASLLWLCGQSPVLLVYKNHMTAGCLAGAYSGKFETLEKPEDILRMIASGDLIIAETTGICVHNHLSFEQSVSAILNHLQSDRSPCRLLNLKVLLRSGSVRTLLTSPADSIPVCPVCGFSQFPVSSDSRLICPACKHSFTVQSGLSNSSNTVSDISDNIVIEPGKIRYGIIRQGACVLKCTDISEETIRLLARWENNPVNCIAARAFEHCSIREIKPLDNIVSIGDYAFRDCMSLESVQLPDILTELGAGAFSSSGLKSIRIPGSIRKIPVFAFSNCNNLDEVIIEDGIQSIDEKAFVHCPNLKQIRVPGSVKTLKKNSFDPCCRIVLESIYTRII